jgi:TonB family protein
MRILALLFLFLSPLCFGQKDLDTVFFNEHWDEISSLDTNGFFGFKDYDENNVGPCTYYYGTGELYSHQMEKNHLKEGYCIWYFKSGNVMAEGNYKKDLPINPTQRYKDESRDVIIQTPPPVYSGDIPEESENDIVDFPDVEAEFRGGAKALQAFVSDNVNYPMKAIELNDQGRVFLSFVVEPDGTLSNLWVERGVSDALDKEALRLLKNMPRWIPGESNGKKVRTRCRLPINFTLDSPTKEVIALEVPKIKESFENYKAAILNDKGKEAIKFVSSQTISYYNFILNQIKFADSTEISALDFIHKMTILSVRHRASKKQIRSFDGKKLLIFAIDEGMVGKASVLDNTIGNVTIEGDVAKGQFVTNGKETPLYFHFHKEDEAWKIDLTSIFPSAKLAFDQIIEDSGMEENDYLLLILEMVSGKKPKMTIWQPVLKK